MAGRLPRVFVLVDDQQRRKIIAAPSAGVALVAAGIDFRAEHFVVNPDILKYYPWKIDGEVSGCNKPEFQIKPGGLEYERIMMVIRVWAGDVEGHLPRGQSSQLLEILVEAISVDRELESGSDMSLKSGGVLENSASV